VKTPARLGLIWLFLWFLTATLLTSEVFHHALQDILSAPSWRHPLGTDAFGRDVLRLSLKASLKSAGFALMITALASLVSIGASLLTALSPKWFQFLLLRSLEIFLAFPSLLFALLWATLRGPGWDTLGFALLIGAAPSLTRLLLVRCREILAEDFILATKSLGATPLRIAGRHLMPGILSLCRIKLPNLFAQCLIAEASLSFLGIGAPLGHDTWGSLLAQGREYLLEAPYLAIGVGLPLVLTVLALQNLSEPVKSIQLFQTNS